MTALKLFLFDLDGTLVSTGGAGMRALGHAFKHLYNAPDAHKRVNPSGKTDPAIFREIVRALLDRDALPDELTQIAEVYLHHLEIEMKTSNTRSLRGVEDFVKTVLGRSNILAGLGTGNLERGARLKLAPTALHNVFGFGGFGSDAEDRAEVLKFGHRRAVQNAGRDIAAEAVFIIGDTLLDVAAAKRAGFRSVAVASGIVSFDELKAGAPDFLLRDLTEGRELLEALVDGARP